MDFFKDIFTGWALENVLGPIIWSIVIPAVLGWVAWLYTRITGKELEAKHREALQLTLANGVRWALQQIYKGKVPEIIPEATREKITTLAADYTVSRAPDAVKFFKMDRWAVEKGAVPHIPLSTDAPKSLSSD